ncbi:MAG: TonB-dependent receptor [Acidobacteriota bacterium]
MLAWFALASGAAHVFGQFLSGGVYGSAIGADGKPLIAVTVKLAGPSPTKPVTTAADGRFRFLGLDPGNYQLHAEAAGFEPAFYPSVAISPGRNTAVQIRLSAQPNETITVTAEPPQFDPTRFTPVLTLSRSEMETIPTTRDPWSLAMFAPGVLASEVNSGGNSSGQQPLLVAPGSNSEQNAFVFDGVVITDMAATGASPTYFDIDQFDEVRVGSGAGDPSSANAGVTIAMVTRGPSNDWRGSVRAFSTKDPNQADSEPSNAVRDVRELGGELGGQLWRDHAWIWDAASSSHILRRAYGGSPVDIRLDNETAKLNLQLGAADSGVVLFNRSYKLWNGRGASPFRSRETWARQTGGVNLGKVENTLLVGSRWSFTGFVSALNGDFGYVPFAGEQAEPVLWPDQVWRGSWFTSFSERNARQWRLTGNTALRSSATDDEHDVAFGVGQRGFTYRMLQFAGARNVIFESGAVIGEDRDLAEAMRQGHQQTDLSFRELWVQDSWRHGRYTVGLGARVDEQSGSERAAHLEANSAFSDALPALDVPARGPQFRWRSLSPRVGIIRELGHSGRTVLGASYSTFASQLGVGTAARGSTYGGYADFLFADQNGDHVYQIGEPIETIGVYDPTYDRVDSRLRPERTDAISFNFEHRLQSEWTVRLDLSQRTVSEVLESRQLIKDASGASRVARREDYALDRYVNGTLPNGTLVQAPIYSLLPGLKPQGRLLVNGDRREVYHGATLTVSRPLRDGWMVRAFATLGDARWHIGKNFRAHDDPTDLALGALPDGIDSADTNGEVVAQQVDQSSRPDTFLNSGWSVGATGMTTVAPSRVWSFLVAANLSGRQGYPIPYAIRALGSDGILRWVQATSRGDDFRTPDLYTVDLRLEKDFERRDFKLAVSIEAFNLLDTRVVLQQSRQLNVKKASGLETMGARVLRAGVRVSFR